MFVTSLLTSIFYVRSVLTFRYMHLMKTLWITST